MRRRSAKSPSTSRCFRRSGCLHACARACSRGTLGGPGCAGPWGEAEMGKVYDALKKAEELRTRRVHETASSASAGPALFDSEGEAAELPEPRRSRSRELLSTLTRVARKGRGPETAGDLNKRRITLLQPESFVAEQFRTLRARLDSLAANRATRTLAVTSALPGDGKT